MSDLVIVGIVDSGFREDLAARVLAAQSLPGDRLGHGSCLLDVIARHAPAARFAVAQVFGDRMVTSAAQVADALDWLMGQGVRVINLSLGLRHDRELLRSACERAVAQGVILCASAPARGEPVYPASYPGVLRMTGDARCQPHQFSHLATRYADYGACVRSDNPAVAGASVGCAHVTGHIARYLCEGGTPQALMEWLDAHAAFIGPEHRTG